MRNILFGMSILIFWGCANTENNNENKSFQWDFSKQKEIIYSYKQSVSGSNQIEKDMPAQKTKIQGDGYLKVTVKKDNIADLSLTELDLNMILFNEDGTIKDTISQRSPDTVVKGMKKDGSFTDPNSNILFDILFPLPSRTLKIGDSEKIAMKMPFNANGHRMSATGYNEITFKGYDTLLQRNCAVFEGVLDISQLVLPADIKGTYTSETLGSATYYFDLEKQYFIGADIEMRMLGIMDPVIEDENKRNMFMKLSSNNTFTIRLDRIDEN